MTKQLSDVKNPERVMTELLRFIKKVMVEPQICDIAKELGRQYIDQPNASRLIAEELSALTSVKIPLEMSEADELFLDLLKEVIRDEQALY